MRSYERVAQPLRARLTPQGTRSHPVTAHAGAHGQQAQGRTVGTMVACNGGLGFLLHIQADVRNQQKGALGVSLIGTTPTPETLGELSELVVSVRSSDLSRRSRCFPRTRPKSAPAHPVKCTCVPDQLFARPSRADKRRLLSKSGLPDGTHVGPVGGPGGAAADHAGPRHGVPDRAARRRVGAPEGGPGGGRLLTRRGVARRGHEPPRSGSAGSRTTQQGSRGRAKEGGRS